jgi:hypothetical protein
VRRQVVNPSPRPFKPSQKALVMSASNQEQWRKPDSGQANFRRSRPCPIICASATRSSTTPCKA